MRTANHPAPPTPTLPTLVPATLTLPALALAALTLPALLASPAARAEEPWDTLAAVRDSLAEAGPTGADFVQTYVPAGFSSGEEESGRLAVALPDCLRWDYAEPYPKSFLLCGERAHYWVPEDGTGRRYRVDREKEPGLDLVLLTVGELERRYRASQEGDDATLTVHLTPTEPSSELAAATLSVDRRGLRLTRLSYQDAEGNSTRFEIRDYRPLDGRELFSPPAGIEWRDEE